MTDLDHIQNLLCSMDDNNIELGLQLLSNVEKNTERWFEDTAKRIYDDQIKLGLGKISIDEPSFLLNFKPIIKNDLINIELQIFYYDYNEFDDRYSLYMFEYESNDYDSVEELIENAGEFLIQIQDECNKLIQIVKLAIKARLYDILKTKENE